MEAATKQAHGRLVEKCAGDTGSVWGASGAIITAMLTLGIVLALYLFKGHGIDLHTFITSAASVGWIGGGTASLMLINSLALRCMGKENASKLLGAIIPEGRYLLAEKEKALDTLRNFTLEDLDYATMDPSAGFPVRSELDVLGKTASQWGPLVEAGVITGNAASSITETFNNMVQYKNARRILLEKLSDPDVQKILKHRREHPNETLDNQSTKTLEICDRADRILKKFGNDRYELNFEKCNPQGLNFADYKQFIQDNCATPRTAG